MTHAAGAAMKRERIIMMEESACSGAATATYEAYMWRFCALRPFFSEPAFGTTNLKTFAHTLQAEQMKNHN